MRIWIINPKLMCNKHLIGEHGELHKFLPSFRKGVKVNGRFSPIVQIQFKGYLKRHNALAQEMLARGMKHKSPLTNVPDFKKIYPQFYNLKVNKQKSLNALVKRCIVCRQLILKH